MSITVNNQRGKLTSIHNTGQHMRVLAIVTGLFLALSAQAAELTLNPVRIAPDVYAVIGDLGAQTYETTV
jgi:hypothetical protein